MKLENIDVIQSLPSIMQRDKDVVAIAYAQTQFYKRLIAKIETATRWGKFDEMTEADLDDVASDLLIPWYKKEDSIETKRNNLKHFVQIWRTIGTPAAIKQVIFDIFNSDATLVEWFEYPTEYQNGEFGIYIAKADKFTKAAKTELARLLSIVRRYSQHMGKVIVVQEAESPIYHATVAREMSWVRCREPARVVLAGSTIEVELKNTVAAVAVKTAPDISIVIAE